MILSHHGAYEFGSPRKPKTAEALALNFADDLDAKMNMAAKARYASAGPGHWSEYHRLLERFLYVGPGPLEDLEPGEAEAPGRPPEAPSPPWPSAKNGPRPRPRRPDLFAGTGKRARPCEANGANLAPFITLEGGEGAGKSTQIGQLQSRIVDTGARVCLTFEPGASELLQSRIVDTGARVCLTFEPGASELGAELRRLVSQPRKVPPSPRAELLMYLADRAQHVETEILPRVIKWFGGALRQVQRFIRGLPGPGPGPGL